MITDNCRSNLTECPRCKEHGLEHFKERSYCYNCNYSNSDDGYVEVPDWALNQYIGIRKQTKVKIGDEDDFWNEQKYVATTYFKKRIQILVWTAVHNRDHGKSFTHKIYRGN